MLRRLGKALQAWSPETASPWSGEPHVLLAAVWGDVVGAEIAANSHPSRLVDGILTIVTRSSAWSQQLSFFTEEIKTAVAARLPATPVAQLRFRVGKLPAAPTRPRVAPAPDAPAGRCDVRAPAASADEAIARFRSNVDERKRAKRAAGWKECTGCGALIAPRGRALCVTCANAGEQLREAAVARLLFEAPWLGFAAMSESVDGLSRREYSRERGRQNDCRAADENASSQARTSCSRAGLRPRESTRRRSAAFSVTNCTT
jgi:hypothetical protein